MKVFDAHSDILTDVFNKREDGEKDILRKYHLDKLKEGGVFATVFAIWHDPEYSGDSNKRVFDILKYWSEEVKEVEDAVVQIKKYEEIAKAEEERKLAVILAMESMAPVDKDLDDLYRLHQYGIRCGSLTWNEENLLATGAAGDSNRGLTKRGIEAIKIMEKLGILLDISHLNEKSFWDAMNNCSKPVIASHSNVYSLCNHVRNLKDKQIKAIQESGGVIGINSCTAFVDREEPTVEKLSHHIDVIVDMVGIDHIGLGLDFCDFLRSETLGIQDQEYKEIKDMPN
ncbi:MAG: membrane dipeptidase, partial [Clostridiaceae bacterium]|nr:membrane dipeptidase [Clostridiaceae bacterium]